MKLLAIFNLATAVFGLECLTCHGRDQGDCEANGRIVVCQEKVKNKGKTFIRKNSTYKK